MQAKRIDYIVSLFCNIKVVVIPEKESEANNILFTLFFLANSFNFKANGF